MTITQPNMAMNIEKVLALIKAERIQIGDIAEKVGLTRAQLSTIRESTNEEKKNEWAQKIAKAYPEVFERDYETKTEESTEKKYTKLLESTLKRIEALLEDAQRENQQLKEQMEEMAKRIIDK